LAKKLQSLIPKAKSDAPGEGGIEADDTVSGIGIDDYPLDQLLIRSEPRAIADVLRRIERKAIKLTPDFERDFVWDDKRQSRLIESVLMRIPLPVFYLAEDTDGSLIVVDGLQRLTTFTRFYSGDLVLDIEKNPELHAKTFESLPQKLKDRFEDGPLTFYLIDPKVPERVRLDIFERVNLGVPLTRQQMRNAIYSGPATAALRELAKGEPFLTATTRSLSSERLSRDMKDREAINRFLAHFTLGWETYGTSRAPDFDEFLALSLKSLNGNHKALGVAKTAFINSMRLNSSIFGIFAFRKSLPPARRQALNVALFEVMSVGLGKYAPPSLSERQQSSIRSGMEKLLTDRDFLKSISDATAEPANVHTRFRKTEAMITASVNAK
jgi:uncharacterized protein DUF262